LYEPILLSAHESGDKADIYVTNDTFDAVSGVLHWALMDHYSNIITQGTEEVFVDALSAVKCASLSFADPDIGFNSSRNYLEYSLIINEKVLCCGTTLFVPSKEFTFQDPQISYRVEDTGAEYLITLQSVAFAGCVCLDLKNDDAIFSDNFFDMSAGERTVTVKKSALSVPLSRECFSEQLTILSLYDIQIESKL